MSDQQLTEDVMNNFNIRECIYDDLDYVESLQNRWAKEDITYGFVPEDRIYLETKLGKYFYVAELEDDIVGFIYGSIRKAKDMAVLDNGQLYIEIEDIYISQNSRDMGLGSILLDKVLEVAKGNGIDRSLIYSSTKDMDDIIKFYKKHDYKTWYIKMFK